MKIFSSDELNNKEIKDAFYRVIEYENLKSVDDIISQVKTKGDKALIELSRRFNDGNFNCADDFLVTNDEIKNAMDIVGEDFIRQIKKAKENIEYFAQKQLMSLKPLEIVKENSILGHKIVPLDKVLCYVPGGNYPLPSSCLMTVIPAKVAGVNEIVLTSPKIRPETIAAAAIAGANKIYKLGGAQAIAAFSLGTETISQVDKIVGPGNKFVTYAKKNMYGTVDIDFLAGPSEVLIIADDSANPDLIAADMLAQCEHDLEARSYLLTPSSKLANSVQKSAENFLNNLPTAEIAKKSFMESFAIVTKDLIECIEISNERAPEHLEIMTEDTSILPELKNYGSLFIGQNCAEVFGDYVSGTNHVLPTNRAARYTGGLSVFDFVKILTYQKIHPSYSKQLSESASFLAKKEGLYAHKLASDLRGGGK